jgi:NAD(P)-dependent dehydrogenase (short-subunit alcohol dehydrogenase family)
MQFLPRQEGRHVVVSGAGTGIGRAIALRLGAEGARLTLLGRRRGPLEETAARCGGTVQVCDIQDKASVDAAFDAAGPIHALVANAGIGGPNEPGEQDRFVDLVSTNLVGTYHCLRAAQRNLVAGPAPRQFVVTASILARFGVPGYTGYCASKAGLLGMVRAFALELASENIRVNAICPGWVDTEMSREGIQGMAGAMGVSFQEAHRVAMSAVPAGRMSTPEEVAGMVAWMLSEDAGTLTGQAIDQNGGAWMG